MAKQFDLSILFRIVDKITTPLKGISRRFQGIGTSVKRLGDRFREMARKAGEAGRRMRDVGRNLMLKVTAPIVAMGVLSLKSAMDFNQAMANIAILIPGQTKRIQQLKNEILDLAEKMGKAPADVAKATYDMISALQDSEETMEKVRLSGMVARAGMTSMTEATKLLIVQTGAYGDTSLEAFKKAANLAFQTVKLGVTTFPELAASMGLVIPLAAQLDVKQESLAGMMATLTGKTGDTSQVATQLAGAMSAILKESPLMEKAVKVLGERFGYSAKSAVELVKEIGFFKAYHQFFEVLGRDEKKMTELIGGRKEALMAIFSLLGKMSEDYIDKSGKMYDVTLALIEAWKEQTEGINKVGFEWDQTKVKFMKVGIIMGDVLLPAFGKLLKFMAPMFKWFYGLSKSTKIFLAALAGIAAFIPGLIFFLGFLGVALKGLAMLSLPALAGAFLPITIAIATLAAGAYLVIKHWKPIKAFFKDLLGWIRYELDLLVKHIQNAVDKILDALPDFAKKKLGIAIPAEPVAKKLAEEMPTEKIKGLIKRMRRPGEGYFERMHDVEILEKELKKREAEKRLRDEINRLKKLMVLRPFIPPMTRGDIKKMDEEIRKELESEGRTISGEEMREMDKAKERLPFLPGEKVRLPIPKETSALEKSELSVTVLLKAEPGTSATVKDVKKVGKVNTRLISESYTGPTWVTG